MISKSNILLPFLLLTNLVLLAQGETDYWYFGNNAGLNFATDPPVALLDGEIDTNEGCAVISDPNGNLLFYTDGSTVWDRNHNIMPNGTGLLGDSSSTQSAIIVPKPGDSSIYYVFTVDDGGGPDGLNYSEVDLSLNGGLGDITALKNEPLTAPTTEKLTAIRKNGLDEYWVLSHRWESDEFVAYEVNNSGVNSTPVVSAVGDFMGNNNGDPNLGGSQGQIKFSTDGTKLAVAVAGQLPQAEIYDFDINTGIVSNHRILFEDEFLGGEFPFVYGVEFSTNNRFLYVVSGILDGLDVTCDITQYDLEAGNLQDIINSNTILHNETGPLYGSLQLANNGKIYVAKEAGAIDVINDPNSEGLLANYSIDAVDLGGRSCVNGLPPFIQSFFAVGFTFENLCAGNATQFTSNISESYDSLLWDFGDTNTSTEENPSHTYATAGTYTVTLTVTSGGQSATETQEVIVFEQPIANAPSNLDSCDTNNDGFLNFNLTQVETAILNGQNPTLFDFTYYANLTDFNTNTPIGNPSSYQNQTPFTAQEIYVRIYNTQNQECFDSTSFVITPFYSPNPAVVIPPLGECDNTSVGIDADGVIEFDLTVNEPFLYNGVPEAEIDINYYEDAGFTQPIVNPTNYVNTYPQETIYVQLVNPNNPTCNETVSFDIEVFALPMVQSPVVLSQCDDDTDGFSGFNLDEVVNEISVNAASEVITFHESEQQALDNINPIGNTIAYQNQNVSTDQVWARIENGNGCIRTSEVQLLVSTTQIPLDFTREFYECDDNINGDTIDGISSFDFSSVTSEIEALFPAGQQLIISYYESLADALSEVNPIPDITNHRNTASPGSQDIYIRVDSLLDNDCLGLGLHITLFVETVPVANPVSIDTLCDTDGDGEASFDTSSIESELLQGQTGMSVSYIDALGNPMPSPLPNPFTTASQNITVIVTNASSQDPDGQCSDQTTISFQVEAAAIANAIPQQRICDEDGDGLFDFDTTGFEATILNGQTGMIVTYTAQDGTVLSSPLPNPFTTATQEVTVRVENQLSAACFDETIIAFYVDEQPEAFPIMDDFVCDDASNDGEEVFTLSLYNNEILNGQSSGTFQVTYHTSNQDAQDGNNPLPTNYTNASNPQEIFARIQNSQNPDCFDITSFEIGVYQLPIAQTIDDMNVCDIDNDGEEIISLSAFSNLIRNGQANSSVSYHLTQSDALSGLNELSSEYLLDTNSIQLYARLESTISSDCYTTTSFSVTLREQPEIDLEPIYYLCDEQSLELSVAGGYDDYEWSTGSTFSITTITDPGGYSITVSNFYGDFVCEETFNFQVIQSGVATITEIVVNDFTQNDNSIEVFVEGFGDYEYSIDGFAWQDENIFENLPLQEVYIVQVRDKNGCGLVAEEAYLMFAPKYFTPNGDGYNDTWNIVNFNRESNGVTHIFDRYGKLLTTLNRGSLGWDGTFNGTIMPSNGYWYRFERGNGQVYVGGFSLIKRGQ